MSKYSIKTFQSSSPVFGTNAGYLEDLYAAYLANPESVSDEWQRYFDLLLNPKADNLSAALQSYCSPLPQRAAQNKHHPGREVIDSLNNKQGAMDQLIDAYRRYGHLKARLNPLETAAPPVFPELSPAFYHLSSSDGELSFLTRGILPQERAPLKEIIAGLEVIYSGHMGLDYMHISSLEERLWLQERLEKPAPKWTAQRQQDILKLLIAADGFETFLATKYVGQKRFSLEGGDSLIPLLDTLFQASAATGVKEIVMGMAHRGRLNVLVNLLGLSITELGKAFEGNLDYGVVSADVKYHRGFSSDLKTKTGKPLHLSLAFNPSHLEFIASVVMGSTYARQSRRADVTKTEAMAIILHGDSAVSGQGVVMETLNMSQTRAYSVGGAVHVIINNQIGFTTSEAQDMRSSRYCSDVFKSIEAPIFHVNGDDPEAVTFLGELALAYRNQFKKDCVIDLVCYRRLGHNEADEPAATQPLMYQKIRQHPRLASLYAAQLIDKKVCSQAEVDALSAAYQLALQEGQSVVETMLPAPEVQEQSLKWDPYIGMDWRAPVNTGVARDQLNLLAKTFEKLPQGFELQRQVNLMVMARAKMTAGELALDWGYAETLAYASLLDEGHPVRLLGQDARRGTFAHRHAAVYDQKTGECYMPLQQLAKKPQDLQIYDSVLSETGALGFEFGYASTCSESLVIWEAQFGDFANGAQVIIDQFLSSAWQKWQRLCGLILFLPHGYEGMGPEHSSARLERYLQLCAEQNMQVCVPTTPAQIFHLIRRQALRPLRSPLVVMTPKSLLRHKLAVSSLEELARGQFQVLIPEIEAVDVSQVQTILFCSGKLYYDLLTKRRALGRNDTAIIRIEQLYPFPYEEVREVLAGYLAKEIVWCQEEPKNQGAWYLTQDDLRACLTADQTLSYRGRPASASPAAGYHALHEKQQLTLLEEAFGLKK